MCELIKIDSLDKLRLESNFIAIDETSPNSFGYVQILDRKIGLSWYGKSQPIIEILNNSNIIIIGAGSTVSFISLVTGVIKLLLPLHNPFGFFLTDEKRIVIVSETTLTILNKANFTIERFTGVPDIIVDGRIESGEIIIEGMEDVYKF